MPRLILGTAGHIDHGKTELVRALTGVDTDRLKEEKERGITIDLGFAELQAGDDLRLGVVDVPGHEGFIRNMLAGATGMDLVLLVVAADEGVMPQTREHLAIVSLLGVERLVVALTKCDLVDGDWLELVQEEVRGLLSTTPYADAPLVPTSARSGEGMEALLATLREVATTAEDDDASDLARLPVDRVFTVRGTGTVVTGTLWSGTLRVGERVRVLPGDLAGRVRGLQVHGRDVEMARAGERTAVALTGSDVERAALTRGQTLVSGPAWVESSIITARLRVLPDVDWALERGQRVRVHLGTAERMARLVLLEDEALMPGDEGWAQLRLEAPALARAKERFVLRSYSPVATVGGGVVAEPSAPKRVRLEAREASALTAILDGSVEDAVTARAEVAGWGGEPGTSLPVTTGLTPRRIDRLLAELTPVSRPVEGNAGSSPAVVSDVLLSQALIAQGVRNLEEAVDAFHVREPLRPGMDVETLRHALPREAHPALADALLERLVASTELVLREGVVSRPGFRVTLRPAQQALLATLEETYRSAGLAPPSLSDLTPELRESADLWPLLRLMESDGRLKRLDTELFIWTEALDGAGAQVRRVLGGRTGLGPADFKDALPVTRKHLLPILSYFDQVGLTLRTGSVREVPRS
jgi:selenocysteine-specific elongation factor